MCNANFLNAAILEISCCYHCCYNLDIFKTLLIFKGIKENPLSKDSQLNTVPMCEGFSTLIWNNIDMDNMVQGTDITVH